MEFSLRKIFLPLLLLGIILNVSGLFTPILEPDGALYAGIAKRMAINNDWINLYGNGSDWLDKPHFPFWMAAVSFKIFGFSSFAYKLPAFLFWLLGLRFTYLLAKKFYNTTTAQLSVLIYVIALHAVISNFDVRAEPYLTTLTIGSIYYLYKLNENFSWKHFFIAALLAACAVMTKGIFILLTVGGGLVLYWIITKQWKQFVNYKWWLFAVCVIIFIIPELYCLYVQFDMHPEKIVFDKTNVSGLKFFFWDSQFGRFFNTGPIKGSGDKLFFFHTILWAFLPWSIYLYIAFFRLITKKKRVTDKKKWIIYGSAGLTFLLFSLSEFQLPHYIIIIFPQLSMMVADDLLSLQKETTKKSLVIIQIVLLITAFVFVVLLSFYGNLPYKIIVCIIALVVLLFGLIKRDQNFIINILYKAFAFATIVYLFLNLIFYPFILQYQSGMFAAAYLNKNNYKGKEAMLGISSYSFELYCNKNVDRIASVDKLKNYHYTNCILYAPASYADSLQAAGYNANVMKTFQFFPVSKLNIHFLNSNTRSSKLQQVALIAVNKR